MKKNHKILAAFLSDLQLKVATTTFKRKSWQITHFFEFLDMSVVDYRAVSKGVVELYLMTLNGINLTKQQHCQVIAQFYDFIGKPDNPTEGFVFLKDKSLKLPKVPTQKTIINRIQNCLALNTDLSIRNALIGELAYGSGLRLAELCNLNVEEIDTEKRTAHLLGKGNKERIVPITSSAIKAFNEYLQRWHRFSGPLFVSKESQRRLHINRIYQIIKETFKLKPHQLRHACASHLLKNGCSIRIIQEILGHNHLTSTQIYTNFNKDELRDVVERCHPAKKRFTGTRTVLGTTNRDSVAL